MAHDHNKKYSPAHCVYQATLWSIRGICQNDHPIPDHEHKRQLLRDTLEAIPQDLHEPILAHILEWKPYPPDIRKRAKAGEKVLVRLMALKLKIMFEWEDIVF